ncbi:alpha/beta fold hydrolase [Fimbriiglobus ruber]|uniref:AB hydrolase-1 domain-containing protein n=1 Tax=Fimbriiglobus ruber TaxID=1908690 RepID=A0A225DVT1_9BACT|nr:alpha/beta hydrolase [Fimbriiglobus ruber]OWK45123.1 hypothetical protein FRUB_01454 [Fimbriiglobus ruber]
MHSPHPTAADLARAVARYDAETRPGVLQTPRYRLRYVSWGKPTERPLVFVHGMADQPRSFAMLMSQLVDAGFWCVGYDLANGASDGAVLGMYKHRDFAADLIALLDHLGAKTVDALGSSFGSTIVLRSLATYPDRFRRAVLQGGFARRPLNRFERGLCRLGRYWPWTMGQLIIRERMMLRYDGPAFDGCPPEVFQFLLQCSGATPARAAARRTLIIDKLDLRPFLPTIPHPVLMIGGDRDAIVFREFEADVERGLKNVRRVEYSPCGHYPQYTMPGPMAAEMKDFLATDEHG